MPSGPLVSSINDAPDGVKRNPSIIAPPDFAMLHPGYYGCLLPAAVFLNQSSVQPCNASITDFA